MVTQSSSLLPYPANYSGHIDITINAWCMRLSGTSRQLEKNLTTISSSKDIVRFFALGDMLLAAKKRLSISG